MKASELRLGNFLLEIDEFVEVGFNTFKDWKKFNFGAFLKPIPLTEEWLIKFGFELKKVSMGGREYEGWVNFSFHLDTNHIENTLFYHWMGGNIEIKHVHQLQNLYFALTNKELELVEDV